MCRQQEERFLQLLPIHCQSHLSTGWNYSSPSRTGKLSATICDVRILSSKCKELHGRYAAALMLKHVGEKCETKLLRIVGLYGESECYIFAIEDQDVNTGHIVGRNIDNTCHLCKRTTEPIQHVLWMPCTCTERLPTAIQHCSQSSSSSLRQVIWTCRGVNQDSFSAITT